MQFKTHLLRVEDGQQVLSNATVRRILGTDSRGGGEHAIVRS